MSIDILDTCAQLNTSEMKLLQFIRKEVRTCGTTIIPAASPQMTPYVRVALKKGYAHLNSMGLISRVSKGVYNINKKLFPSVALVPQFDLDKEV